MTTPRKRTRVEDDEDEDESPSFLARVTGLFSTAKKQPKRQKRSVEPSTQPTQLPRLNLSSPHAHVSPLAETGATRAPPVPTEVAANGASTPAPVPAASRPPPPSPWQAAPIRFSPAFSAPLASNRPRPYRPMSRTLVVAARRRQRPRNTEFNAELVARILAQSESLFQPQDNGYRATTTTVRGRRLMGTNQSGSRLAAAAAAPPPTASRQVRFEEPPAHVQEPSQGMVATPRLRPQTRVATPYVARPAQPELSPEETIVSGDKEYTLPVDYSDMDRPAASPDDQYVFDVDEYEPGDAPPTALVASTRSFRTFSATSAPQPSRDPRHLFQLVELVSEPVVEPVVESTTKEDDIVVETVEESPTKEDDRKLQEEPAPKKGRWGIFAEKPEGWKCKVCQVTNNPLSETKCQSCETPRPGFEGEAKGGGAGAAGGGAAAVGGSNEDGASGAAVPFVFGANGNGASGAAPLFAFGGATGFKFGGTEETKNEEKGVFQFGTTASRTGGFSFGTSEKLSQAQAPKLTGFSFGNTNESKEDAPKTNGEEDSEKKEGTETPETAVLPSNVPFSFGTSAPSDSVKFSFSVGGMTTTPSAPPVATALPTTLGPASAFGSIAPAPSHDDSRKKKRRSTDDDKDEEKESTSTAARIQAPSLFGSNAPNVGQPFVFTAPATPAKTPTDSVSFGASTAARDSLGGAAVSLPAPAPSGNAPTFGATPAPAASAPSFAFGSTPVASSIRAPASEAPTPSTGGFGQSGSNTFGTSGFNFGVSSTASAMTPAPAAPAFNFGGTSTASVMTPAPAVPAFAFGGVSTAAPAAPTGFGATAPPPPSQGFSFGSTPVPSYVATFGAPAAVAPAPPPAGLYGATAAATPGGFSLSGFGGPTATPAPTPGFGGFGVTTSMTPAVPGDFGATPSIPPFTPASAGGGFSIGTGGGTGGRSAPAAGRRRIVRAKRPPGSSGR